MIPDQPYTPETDPWNKVSDKGASSAMFSHLSEWLRQHRQREATFTRRFSSEETHAAMIVEALAFSQRQASESEDLIVRLQKQLDEGRKDVEQQWHRQNHLTLRESVMSVFNGHAIDFNEIADITKSRFYGLRRNNIRAQVAALVRKKVLVHRDGKFSKAGAAMFCAALLLFVGCKTPSEPVFTPSPVPVEIIIPPPPSPPGLKVNTNIVRKTVMVQPRAVQAPSAVPPKLFHFVIEGGINPAITHTNNWNHKPAWVIESAPSVSGPWTYLETVTTPEVYYPMTESQRFYRNPDIVLVPK